MSKHAPATWKYSLSDYGCSTVVRDKNNRIIAFVEMDVTRKTQDEDIANARLIAAAPELLEMVKELTEILGGYDDSELNALLSRIEGETGKGGANDA